MAIEVFPDSPRLGMSPRISFSYDLPQNDVVPVEQYIRSASSSSSIDFDFCVFRGSFDQESSSTADELFSNGKILPIEVKRRLAPPRKSAAPPLPPPRPPPENQEIVNRRSIASEKKNPGSESKEKQSNSKSWFKRSTSLNCGSGYCRTLCSLTLLSRSNSTGSTGSGKRSSVSNSQKQSLLKSSAPNSSEKQTQSAYSSKPPLKKSSNHAFYSKGVKFNPVLNVPPANLFGLGSIFSGGRDKSRKK